MRSFLIISLSILAAACSGEPAAENKMADPPQMIVISKEALEDARVAAVLLRADWCTSCKILEPKLDVVKAQDAIDGLAHVTIDYTDRDKGALYAAAVEIGVGEAIYKYLDGDVTTGIVLLVDLASNEVVGDLRKSLSEVELREAMTKAAA
ncbi:MAG: thioredoxin family protein [Marinicaulis sp.]|nr:thioredoxin family protein [Marinicaulis sp.]